MKGTTSWSYAPYRPFFRDVGDIIFLCRTAMNEPRNHHDSNYQTFHRIKSFRAL